MRIFHVARRSNWIAALRKDEYVSPSQETDGYLGAARRNQVAGVLERYSQVTEPLVVLEIETDLLDVPWLDSEVDGTSYPHVLGPLPVQAVLQVIPAQPHQWSRRGVRPMAPPEVNVFGGLAVVLGVTALVLLFTAGIAHFKAHPSADAFGSRPRPSLPPSVEFLLWSLTVASAAAAVTAWIVAVSLRADYRSRTAWRP